MVIGLIRTMRISQLHPTCFARQSSHAIAGARHNHSAMPAVFTPHLTDIMAKSVAKS